MCPCEEDALRLSKHYHVLSDLERIGDHALNIAEYADSRKERGVSFSPEALAELKTLVEHVITILNRSYEYFLNKSNENFTEIEALEQHIDELVDRFEQNHIERLNAGLCNAQSGLIFSEILTDLERVSDHCFNIAEAAI